MSGLLGDLLPQLDIPATAKLVAIETHFGEDGSQTWTVTFRSSTATTPAATSQGAPGTSTSADYAPVPAPPATLTSAAPGVMPPLLAAAAPALGSSTGLPPRPPPLTDLQLAGGSRPPTCQLPASFSRDGGAPSDVQPPQSPSSNSGPPPPSSPAAFPLLPFQVGAVNRLFPLRAHHHWSNPTGTNPAGPLKFATRMLVQVCSCRVCVRSVFRLRRDDLCVGPTRQKRPRRPSCCGQ